MDDSPDDRSTPTWWAAEVESRAEDLRGGIGLSALLLALRGLSAANRVLSGVRNALKR